MPARRTEVLRRWHQADPVSTDETTRNAAVQRLQGNRNPFVDCPLLVERIDAFNPFRPYDLNEAIPNPKWGDSEFSNSRSCRRLFSSKDRAWVWATEDFMSPLNMRANSAMRSSSFKHRVFECVLPLLRLFLRCSERLHMRRPEAGV